MMQRVVADDREDVGTVVFVAAEKVVDDDSLVGLVFD